MAERLQEIYYLLMMNVYLFFGEGRGHISITFYHECLQLFQFVTYLQHSTNRVKLCIITATSVTVYGFTYSAILPLLFTIRSFLSFSYFHVFIIALHLVFFVFLCGNVEKRIEFMNVTKLCTLCCFITFALRFVRI